MPVNLAKSVMEQIIKEGRVARGSLGVVVQPITPDLAKHFKLSEETGALIGEVVPGGAAAQAGMRIGRHHHRVSREENRRSAALAFARRPTETRNHGDRRIFAARKRASRVVTTKLSDENAVTENYEG